MEPTKELLLRDPNIQPTSDVIENALGEANNAYVIFVNELTNYDIQLTWQYYSDGKAWLAKGQYISTGARGGQKETTIFWLSIWDSSFKVTIYIPEKARTDVLNLPLENEVKLMITNSKQMGKLKFFPLIFEMNSVEMVKDIFTLVKFKKNIS